MQWSKKIKPIDCDIVPAPDAAVSGSDSDCEALQEPVTVSEPVCVTYNTFLEQLSPKDLDYSDDVIKAWCKDAKFMIGTCTLTPDNISTFDGCMWLKRL